MLHSETSTASEADNEGFTFSAYWTKWEPDVPELHSNVPDDPNIAEWEDPSLAYCKPTIIKIDGAPQMLCINVGI